jgi:hypothetical protein
MKLVYVMTHCQFGKVITPSKVFCACLPIAFGQFYGKISALDKKLLLPPETVMLFREQVARTNACLFCLGIEIRCPRSRLDQPVLQRCGTHLTGLCDGAD